MTFNDIKDIKAMIEKMVSDKIDAGQVVNMQWAVTDILNEYSDIDGSDVDFYIITARQYANDLVKACIKKYESSDDGLPGQIVLEGFEYLQKAYPILRDKTRVLVPISDMSDEELSAKADEKYAMAKGNKAHGDEIIHYVDSRRAAG